MEGHVYDLNGKALSQAMITVSMDPGQPGPSAITTFTDENGRFQFPDYAGSSTTPTAKALGYRQVDTVTKHVADGVDVTVIMRFERNQNGVAPASAWLAHISDPKDRMTLVMNCTGCHQMPAPAVREYAKLTYDTASGEPAATQSWHALTKYMNRVVGQATAVYLGVDGQSPEAANLEQILGIDADAMAPLLARSLVGPMDRVEGYQYGVPVIANSHTVIREYEVPRPNAIREAITLDDPNVLWVADADANRLIRLDAVTGAQKNYDIPGRKITSLHTLARSNDGKSDGKLWILPMLDDISARFDPKGEQWQSWKVKGEVRDGVKSLHDPAMDSNRNVTPDQHGRIWYTDIVDNGIGWLNPTTGQSGLYPVPPVPGRTENGLPYGSMMTSDHKHVWYLLFGIGAFGSFNTETLKFETVVQLPDKLCGPRRGAISDSDILYVALFGTGQLAEYDTRRQKMIGVYDLPDRASAPYGATWDPKRKVLWIPTSNANLIYRFDPRDKSFAALPLPRESAFLRMLAVDRTTGALTTAYANLNGSVQGPRMAVVINLGDGPTTAGAPKATAPQRSKSQ